MNITSIKQLQQLANDIEKYCIRKNTIESAIKTLSDENNAIRSASLNYFDDGSKYLALDIDTTLTALNLELKIINTKIKAATIGIFNLAGSSFNVSQDNETQETTTEVK